MPKILILHDAPHQFDDRLTGRFPGLEFNFVTSGGEVAQQLEETKPEIVFSIKSPGFPDEFHRLAVSYPSVQWLHVGGSGFDHLLPIDNDALTLTNCAGVLAPFLAETVIGAMLAINGNFLPYLRQQRQRQWRPIAFRPLHGQTLLIVGLGEIGGRVASHAKVLGMHVIGVRRRQEDVPNVDEIHPPDAIDEVLGRADMVSLHVRLNEDTHHLFNKDRFERMKPGAILLNTSRGGVVDTQALIAALDQGQLGGAYLDVFEQEPLPGDHPLWAREDIFMMPHASDNIIDWQVLFADVFADNLERWIAGEPLLHQVTC